MPQRSTVSDAAASTTKIHILGLSMTADPLPCMIIMSPPSMLTINRGKNHMEIL
jgi:hypothetical protein